jgi:hypothetical protein
MSEIGFSEEKALMSNGMAQLILWAVFLYAVYQWYRRRYG